MKSFYYYTATIVLLGSVLLSTSCDRREEAAVTVNPFVQAEDVLNVSQVDRGPATHHQTDIIGRRLHDTPFEFSWDLQMPAKIHASWISPNGPELIFYQLVNGQVHCVESRTGHTKWVSAPLQRLIQHRPYFDRDVIPGKVAGKDLNDDRLYIIGGDMLYCIDGHFGQTIWTYHLGRSGKNGFEPSAGPMVQGVGDNARVFIPDWEGRMRVIAYDAKKQRTYMVWQWNIYATPTTRPVGKDGITYLGDAEGNLHAFGMEREVKWTFNTRGSIEGEPGIRGRNLYVVSEANVLHVLHRLSGKEIARRVLGAPMRRQPFSFIGEPDRVYVFTSGSNQGLHSIYSKADQVAFSDAADKYPKEIERMAHNWFVPDIDRVISSSPSHLFVTKKDSVMVLALNRQSGKIDWQWDINLDRKGTVSKITVYIDPTDTVRSIFTADDDGYVIAYRLFGQF